MYPAMDYAMNLKFPVILVNFTKSLVVFSTAMLKETKRTSLSLWSKMGVIWTSKQQPYSVAVLLIKIYVSFRTLDFSKEALYILIAQGTANLWAIVHQSPIKILLIAWLHFITFKTCTTYPRQAIEFFSYFDSSEICSHLSWKNE